MPRNLRASPLYQLVEDHYEAFEGCYDERYQGKYGFWRPVVKDVFLRYLDCGCLHGGFARIRCEDCGDEYLLPYSCKCRCFCPSCSQRRALELGESLTEEIIDAQVPIRTSTFTIPKMLRIYFMFDHKLYPRLCQCAFETVKELFQAALGREDVVPGMVIGIHTWGSFVNTHPHLHGMLCQGCYDKEGNFHPLPDAFDEKKSEKLFMHKVFKMLLVEDKINESVIENLMSWHNSGFNVHFSDVLYPDDRENREKAARYLVRAPISLSKMSYKRDEGKVVYGNQGGEKRVFEALDFLALVSSHIPDRFENRILYYGYWSKKSRGLRKKREEELSAKELTVAEPSLSSRICRRRWAALIRKIWETDPLICRACGGSMKIISFIDDFPVY
ncbi:MAG: transposase [Candidatus Eremiobacteraeota bacterium]|nr:transposase [Candidatus Eremiobacteraeota bacterium]